VQEIKLREIKFRGMKANGEWTYGYFVKKPLQGCTIVDLIGFEHDVTRSTVGQATGIRDRNGVEVYEGDVVECDHNYKGVIRYDEHHEGGGRFLPIDDNNCFCEVFLDKERWYRLEVIGNIHEGGVYG
jgi:uncharacterized phage protein (TIGR01671 family)